MPKPRVKSSAIDIMLDEIGKNRSAISDYTGIRMQTFSKWSNNRTIKNTRMKTFYQLADFFNMDIKDFVDKVVQIENEMNSKKK